MKKKHNKIAFFGIGYMGEPMAQRLMDAGYELLIYNRTLSKTRSLQERGAAVARQPGEAVAEADVILVMLADYPAIEAVFFNRPVATDQWQNKTFIQMGTIAPAESLEIQARLEAGGGEYLEAPVLGGIPQIADKTLQVLVGGSDTQFQRWESLFAPFSDYRFHVGEVGKGAAMKLALNQMALSQTAALAMSVGYLSETGADVHTFMKILRNSAFYAKALDRKVDLFLERDYTPIRFPLKLMLKDGSLMRDHFSASGIDTAPLAGIVRVLQKAVEKGYGHRDSTSIYDAFYPPKEVT